MADDGPCIDEWTVAPERHDDYRFLLDHDDLRLIVSGHLHRRAEFHEGSVRHLWAPSTAFVMGPAIQPNFGGQLKTGQGRRGGVCRESFTLLYAFFNIEIASRTKGSSPSPPWSR
jgi:hypothetical protein